MESQHVEGSAGGSQRRGESWWAAGRPKADGRVDVNLRGRRTKAGGRVRRLGQELTRWDEGGGVREKKGSIAAVGKAEKCWDRPRVSCAARREEISWGSEVREGRAVKEAEISLDYP